jgi:hypothetical protein
MLLASLRVGMITQTYGDSATDATVSSSGAESRPGSFGNGVACACPFSAVSVSAAL